MIQKKKKQNNSSTSLWMLLGRDETYRNRNQQQQHRSQLNIIIIILFCSFFSLYTWGAKYFSWTEKKNINDFYFRHILFPFIMISIVHFLFCCCGIYGKRWKREKIGFESYVSLWRQEIHFFCCCWVCLCDWKDVEKNERNDIIENYVACVQCTNAWNWLIYGELIKII